MIVDYTINLKTDSKTYEDIMSLLRTSNLRYTTEYSRFTEELKIVIRIDDMSINNHIKLINYTLLFPNNNIHLSPFVSEVNEELYEIK